MAKSKRIELARTAALVDKPPVPPDTRDGFIVFPTAYRVCMTEPAKIRLGTRGSPLALWQADWVTARLEAAGVSVERVLISTSGDRDQSASITAFGTIGAFTKEIQRALVDGRIDVAVHSLKDLPTEPTPGLEIAAIPERGPCGDVLVTVDGRSLADLPEGARVGTGSLRRRAALWHVRPDLKMLDIRGNVDTRLRKLEEGQYDAVVLAEAGLSRLGLGGEMIWRIDHETMLPAVGQGALGIETRVAGDAADNAAYAAIGGLDDRATRSAVLAERALLAKLCAGCLAPVGAFGRVGEDGSLMLSAAVFSPDGRRKLSVNISGSAEDRLAVGERAAMELLSQGADELVRQARGEA
jgi:hydroxymethylbilane synthase